MQNENYLRVGSNPVINSGHNVYADEPANVSGQHDHPSHVPLQYLPKTIRKNTMFYINNTSLDDEMMLKIR